WRWILIFRSTALSILSLSLHDALAIFPIAVPIIIAIIGVEFVRMAAVHTPTPLATALGLIAAIVIGDIAIKVGLLAMSPMTIARSEEHTSELQSRFDIVCRLRTEEKKA